MALINCPGCNKEISDTALTCPHCGYQLKKSQIKTQAPIRKTDRKIVSLETTMMICLTIVWAILSGCYHRTVIPDGIADAKFGMTPTEVKAAWEMKADSIFDLVKKKSNIDGLICNNLTVGSETFDMATADFVSNKLYRVFLLKFPSKGDSNREIYDRLQSILNGKYIGATYQKPTSADYVGKALVKTTWDYSPISLIELSVEAFTDSLAYVTLEYRSVKLYREFEKVNANGF